MAIIVGGSPMGMLSGKMGGYVFSHNKSGQYVRQFVIPSNPDTVAQNLSRSRFGAGAANWGALSAGQQAAWNSFAANIFSPKTGTNNGQYSGFSAFCSLSQSALQGQALKRAGTMKVNGGALGVPATFADFVAPVVAPALQVEPAIKEQVTGNPLALILIDADCTVDAAFEFKLSVAGGPAGGSDIEDFIDSNGWELCFSVFLSNPRPKAGMFYANPFMYTLGSVGHPTWDAADLLGVETLSFQATNFISTSDYQSFPTEGDWCKMSVYVKSRNGMMACVGSKEVQIAV